MPAKSITIVIPNYNGRDLLQQNLPHVLAAAAAHGDAEVLVVDDGSDDSSRQLIRRRFDAVRLLALDSRQGFISAINSGVQAAEGQVVVLLNSDVRVDEDFLPPLEEALESNTFAVSARSITETGLNEGLSRALFLEGDLSVIQPGIEAPDIRHELRCTNFHASGGFSAFDRSKFLELGGLDPLYHPFYWEDVDICYRAWKRGWRVIYEPRSRVHHLSHGTISCYFTRTEVSRIYESNKHAFIMKNITEEPLLEAYLERLTKDLLERPRSFADRRRAAGAFEMLKRARKILARRRACEDKILYSDSEILKISANMPC